MTKKELKSNIWGEICYFQGEPSGKCSICKKFYENVIEIPIKHFDGNKKFNFCEKCFVGEHNE